MTKKISFLFVLFAQAYLGAEEVVAAPPDRSSWHTFTMLALAGILFYFVLFRPEQKRRKEVETLRSKMKKGDKVTAMGIIGTVAKVQEHTVVVRMYDGSKLEFVKGAITEVEAAQEEVVPKEASAESPKELKEDNTTHAGA